MSPCGCTEIECGEVEEEDQFFDSRDDLSWMMDSSSDNVHLNFDACINSLGSVHKKLEDEYTQCMGQCDPQRWIFEEAGMRGIDSSSGTSSMSGCLSDGTGTVLSEFTDIENITPRQNISSHDTSITSSPSSVSSARQRQGSTTSTSGSGSDSKSRKGKKMGWLKVLGVNSCFVDKQFTERRGDLDDSINFQVDRVMTQRVRVKSNRKSVKEFSAVYRGQDIKAHQGAIMTMKFSCNGHYLATGGEDRVVRVWHVMECDRDDMDFSTDNDPSCVYFKVKHNSAALVPISFDDKTRKSKQLKRRSDSACIVFPSKVFMVLEEPVHVFRGHGGDVLDISWSKDRHILSASTDKTVRLWRVGNHSCLKIFSHMDYVTCVQFNPVDNNYFMSGSIDGKVRIWEISARRVVDWMDVKDIVTAVCYQPDGMGGVVGTIEGDCRFYASENQLQLEAIARLPGKRKSPFNRITGLQFCPTDHRKLLVTSSNSKVRILDGFGVTSKFKGLANACSQITASFTPDGQHIISASDDSNVHIWSHSSDSTPTSKHVKKVSSYERFYSRNASVAIPWHGIKASGQVSQDLEPVSPQQDRDLIASRARVEENDFLGTRTLRPSGSFVLGQEYLPDFSPRGSATWPEERLPSATQALCRSQFKLLMNSFHNTSHEWGRVIVTGGWDGWIRTFQNFGLPVDR